VSIVAILLCSTLQPKTIIFMALPTSITDFAPFEGLLVTHSAYSETQEFCILILQCNQLTMHRIIFPYPLVFGSDHWEKWSWNWVQIAA
jgi:hypothetical protein